MNITVVNQPLGNRGDESAHRSFIRMLNQELPESKITVLFCGASEDNISQFKVTSQKINYVNIKPFLGHGFMVRNGFKFRLVNIFSFIHPSHYKVGRILKRSDLIVCSPGGVCMGPYQSWDHLWFLKLSIIYDKKVAYFGRSFGPFPTITKSNKLFKKISLDILYKLNFILLRDSISQNLAEKLSLKFSKTVDSAFLEKPLTNVPENLKNEISDNYLVFVPNELKWNPKFNKINFSILNNFYCKIIDHLLSFDNLNIVMLPQLFNHGELNDFNYFKRLKQQSGNDNRIKVITDNYSSDIQQKIISNAKYMIGARYHSVVFAINNDTPFTAISYEHKITGLLTDLGLENSFVDFSFLFEKNDESIISEMNHTLEKIFININNVVLNNNIPESRLSNARIIVESGKSEFLSFIKNCISN